MQTTELPAKPELACSIRSRLNFSVNNFSASLRFFCPHPPVGVQICRPRFGARNVQKERAGKIGRASCRERGRMSEKVLAEKTGRQLGGKAGKLDSASGGRDALILHIGSSVSDLSIEVCGAVQRCRPQNSPRSRN